MRTQCQWGHIIDVVPTCLAVVVGEYPRTYAGEERRAQGGKRTANSAKADSTRQHAGGSIFTDYEV